MRMVILGFRENGIMPKSNCIEVYAVEMVDGVKTGKTLHSYLNPEESLDQDILELTDLSNEFISTKPTIVEFLPELIKFIDKSDIMLYCANVMVKYLNKSCNEIKSNLLWDSIGNIYCGYENTKKLLKNDDNLQSLCSSLGMELSYNLNKVAVEEANMLAYLVENKIINDNNRIRWNELLWAYENEVSVAEYLVSDKKRKITEKEATLLEFRGKDSTLKLIKSVEMKNNLSEKLVIQKDKKTFKI